MEKKKKNKTLTERLDRRFLDPRRNMVSVCVSKTETSSQVNKRREETPKSEYFKSHSVCLTT